MAAKTCAACDCKLDGNPIKVKLGGRTVEVCCDECAGKAEGSALFHHGIEKAVTMEVKRKTVCVPERLCPPVPAQCSWL